MMAWQRISSPEGWSYEKTQFSEPGSGRAGTPFTTDDMGRPDCGGRRGPSTSLRFGRDDR